MDRKRRADGGSYNSAERVSSKERKISNDYDGRLTMRESHNFGSSDYLNYNCVPNSIQVLEDYQPEGGNHLDLGMDKETQSNAAETVFSFCQISSTEADRIRQSQMLKLGNGFQGRRKWTKDEIKLLDYAVKTYCEVSKKKQTSLTTKDYQNIPWDVPGRTNTQCMSQWKKRNKDLAAYTKKSWSTRENQILSEIVQGQGAKNWKLIAESFNLHGEISKKRNGKQ